MPNISPCRNPKPAAIGDPDVAIIEECVANCDAVLLSACTTCPSALVSVALAAFSISILCMIDMQDQLQITNNYCYYFQDFPNGIASNCSKQESPTSRKKKIPN
jgi:hypothetical protein